MKTPEALALALLLAGSARGQASNCEPIRDQIEARMRAGGLTRFTLTVLDQDAPAQGRVVGSCDRGRKKIVYAPGAPAPRDDALLTECRDGTVSIGGDCRKKR